MHLKTGQDRRRPAAPAKDGFDLPRGGTGANGEAQGDHPRPAQRREPRGRPDPLRDDPLPQPRRRHACRPRSPRRSASPTAREIVTKHYQWMLRTDYLPRICAPGVVNDVFNNGRKAFEVGATPTDVPTMPIEFSVAAFRLGHSMVRAAYNWNKVFDDGSPARSSYLFDVLGARRRPRRRPACSAPGSPTSAGSTTSARPAGADLEVPANKFNRAMRIDTSLVDPLKHLPPRRSAAPTCRSTTRTGTSRSAT